MAIETRAGFTMRTTITLDDDLLQQAEAAIGTTERSVVLREALQALVQREAARRLIQLGGSVPDAPLPPRRRPVNASRSHGGKGVGRKRCRGHFSKC